VVQHRRAARAGGDEVAVLGGEPAQLRRAAAVEPRVVRRHRAPVAVDAEHAGHLAADRDRGDAVTRTGARALDAPRDAREGGGEELVRILLDHARAAADQPRLHLGGRDRRAVER
jgi:hypothetical protein